MTSMEQLKCKSRVLGQISIKSTPGRAQQWSPLAQLIQAGSVQKKGTGAIVAACVLPLMEELPFLQLCLFSGLFFDVFLVMYLFS